MKVVEGIPPWEKGSMHLLGAHPLCVRHYAGAAGKTAGDLGMVVASARGQGHRGSLPRAWVFSSCTCNLQWAGAASLETPRSIKRCSLLHWASLMARTIKNLPAMQET